MASTQERSPAGAAPTAESSTPPKAERTWRGAIERHSGLVIAGLTTLTAALTFATTFLGFWAARAVGERNDLEGSQGTLERQVEALEAENAQLAEDLRAAQDALENPAEGNEPTTDDESARGNSTSTHLASLEAVSGWFSEEPVTISGTEYAQGLSWMSAGDTDDDETVEYALSRDYTRLTGVAGLADDTPSTVSGYIEIQVDGEVRQSAPLEYGNHVPIDVDLSDALRLSITVSAPEWGEVVALGDLMLES